MGPPAICLSGLTAAPAQSEFVQLCCPSPFGRPIHDYLEEAHGEVPWRNLLLANPIEVPAARYVFYDVQGGELSATQVSSLRKGALPDKHGGAILVSQPRRCHRE